MLLVIPIGVGIVLRQIHTQRGIRVELLDTKAAMDGSLVELLGGIQVIRVTDSTAAEERRFEGKSETLRAKEMTHHIAMARYDCLKFLNQVFFTVLMIGVSAWLATRGIITVGAVLTAYLCFNQLLKPLEELHRILDELSESMILARIFLRRPRLLILDEATSALDNTSERFVQNQIEALQRETGMTVLSIAHRLTTLQNAHRILVMDKGKLVQEGSYKELVETPGIFQDMYYGRLK